MTKFASAGGRPRRGKTHHGTKFFVPRDEPKVIPPESETLARRRTELRRQMRDAFRWGRVWRDVNPPALTDEVLNVGILLEALFEAKCRLRMASWSALDSHRLKVEPEARRDVESLLAAAKAMDEHNVDPVAFAVWRLSYEATRQGKKVARASPTRIFDAKFIDEKAGWFRKENPLESFHEVVVDPIAVEQVLRRREAILRNSGLSQEDTWQRLPSWYVDKRRSEGVDDPNEHFPRREK